MADDWLPGIAATVRPLTRTKYEQVIRGYVAKRDIGAVPLRT